MMAAPKGNNYWQFRNKHGRDHKYKPDALWEEFIMYYEWIVSTPLKEAIVIQRGITIGEGENKKTVYTTDVNKMRAMTITGFCLFADIVPDTFYEYEKHKDFIEITTRVRESIYNYKFEGAAASLLHPNIIARELGLAEKREHESPNGSMSPKPNIIVTSVKAGKEIDKLIKDENSKE